MLLASSLAYSPSSSIRLPSQSQYIPDSSKDGNTTAWKRDREATRRYFDLPECFVRPSKFLFSLQKISIDD